jgi:hypothetical protein
MISQPKRQPIGQLVNDLHPLPDLPPRKLTTLKDLNRNLRNPALTLRPSVRAIRPGKRSSERAGQWEHSNARMLPQ